MKRPSWQFRRGHRIEAALGVAVKRNGGDRPTVHVVNCRAPVANQSHEAEKVSHEEPPDPIPPHHLPQPRHSSTQSNKSPKKKK